jgi:hypothetical protein
LLTKIGEVRFTRRYWKCRCVQAGGYAVDGLLGVEGERQSKALQRHLCQLGAEMSFARAAETIEDFLGVELSAETTRKVVEGHGKRMAEFQATDTASEHAFENASGEVEFTTDAGKVNTREEGWKDLKIGVFSKREAGEPTTPENWKKQRLPAAVIVLAFALIAPAKEFRRHWRPRMKRLGVTCLASVQVLGDGASWIWKAVGRVLTGCVQTLDFYHACQHLAKCAERVFGEATTESKGAYRHGRMLLAKSGWSGVCQWVLELLTVEDGVEQERRRKATDRLIGYFSKQTNRLNYAEGLACGRAIGSGQVEGQAKTLGLRLKARGARWRKVHVRPMASLVCVRHSRIQWTAYWAMAA